jgi:hypothetical protein
MKGGIFDKVCFYRQLLPETFSVDSSTCLSELFKLLILGIFVEVVFNNCPLIFQWALYYCIFVMSLEGPAVHWMT